MLARGGRSLPDPLSSGGGAAGGGNILGFVMSATMALLAGFCYIVDRFSAAMGISTWLSVPVALAVCGVAFKLTVLAVALPFIAHDYHSIRNSQRLCIALVIGTSGLTGNILAGMEVGFAVLL